MNNIIRQKMPHLISYLNDGLMNCADNLIKFTKLGLKDVEVISSS